MCINNLIKVKTSLLSQPQIGENMKNSVTNEHDLMKMKDREVNSNYTICQKVWRNQIKFICGNVRSISCKTAISKVRLMFITDKINREKSEFAIFVETNITNAQEIRVPGYECFFADLTTDKGILILVQSELHGIKLMQESNIGLSVHIKKLKCNIVAVYCPTINERFLLSEFIFKNTQSRNYIVFGDFEEANITYFKKNKCNWIQADYSRIQNQSKHNTEMAFSNWKIDYFKREEKVCDHFLLEGKISMVFKVKICTELEICRNAILNKIFNNSVRKNIWLMQWPYFSTREIFSRLKLLKRHKTNIYMNNVNVESFNKLESERIL